MSAGKRRRHKPTVVLVGAGSLANVLAAVLPDAGFEVEEIVVRDTPRARRRGRVLAARAGARVVSAQTAKLEATILWFCVPDGEIQDAAASIAERLAAGPKSRIRFAFHSSGALLSDELDSLRKTGVSVASVHPLMTFVAGARPSLPRRFLHGVPFALEGDARAVREARRMVCALGGESFSLPANRKAAYHAWATLTSPLLLALLVTLEEAALAAGLGRRDARRKSLPIIRQTLANYSRLGPARSFSGPLVRGDADTVGKHLAMLKKHPGVREVYLALARAALRGLPVKNQGKLKRLLRD